MAFWNKTERGKFVCDSCGSEVEWSATHKKDKSKEFRPKFCPDCGVAVEKEKVTRCAQCKYFSKTCQSAMGACQLAIGLKLALPSSYCGYAVKRND